MQIGGFNNNVIQDLIANNSHNPMMDLVGSALQLSMELGTTSPGNLVGDLSKFFPINNGLAGAQKQAKGATKPPLPISLDDLTKPLTDASNGYLSGTSPLANSFHTHKGHHKHGAGQTDDDDDSAQALSLIAAGAASTQPTSKSSTTASGSSDPNSQIQPAGT